MFDGGGDISIIWFYVDKEKWRQRKRQKSYGNAGRTRTQLHDRYGGDSIRLKVRGAFSTTETPRGFLPIQFMAS